MRIKVPFINIETNFKYVYFIFCGFRDFLIEKANYNFLKLIIYTILTTNIFFKHTLLYRFLVILNLFHNVNNNDLQKILLLGKV